MFSRVVYQGCCLGLSRTSSVKKGHAVVLYAKDQTLLLLTKDRREQEEWFLALKKQFEKEQKDGQSGDTFDEEDDGYCTLPPAAIFKEVSAFVFCISAIGTKNQFEIDLMF